MLRSYTWRTRGSILVNTVVHTGGYEHSCAHHHFVHTTLHCEWYGIDFTMPSRFQASLSQNRHTFITAVFKKIELTEKWIKLLFLRSLLSHGSILLRAAVGNHQQYAG